MSDAFQYLDPDDDEFFDAPKALRDHVKALQKRLSKANEDLGSARGQLATRALSEVLAGQQFKNPKRVEQDLLRDGVDPLNESAVNAWLTSNGDDYAKGEAAPAAPAAEASVEQQSAPPVSQEIQNGYQNLQVPGAQPAGADKIASVISKITPDMDGKAVEKLFAEHGI